MESALDRRSREVLQAVVHAHVLTGEPVGSRTIAKKYGLGVSPATVRNVMADLEEMGFLTHPHTSAGRVPTDRGFRFYVDRLMGQGRSMPDLLKRDLDQLEVLMLRRDLSASEALVEASRILSKMSNQMGLVFIPALRSTRFRHIQFVPLGSRKVLVLIVAEGGIIQHKTVILDEGMSTKELEKYGQLLSSQFSGRTLVQVRKALVEAMEQDIVEYDALYSRALRMANRALESFEEAEAVFHVEGASNILSQKEFGENVERMRGIFKAFEEKSKVVKLLDRCIQSDDLVVVIGGEGGIEELQDLSLVTSRCSIGDSVIGGLGIMGPRRMDYASLLPLMREVSQLINVILTV
jgi:heat-inducible transcriptional repressor